MPNSYTVSPYHSISGYCTAYPLLYLHFPNYKLLHAGLLPARAVKWNSEERCNENEWTERMPLKKWYKCIHHVGVKNLGIIVTFSIIIFTVIQSWGIRGICTEGTAIDRYTILDPRAYTECHAMIQRHRQRERERDTVTERERYSDRERYNNR